MNLLIGGFVGLTFLNLLIFCKLPQLMPGFYSILPLNELLMLFSSLGHFCCVLFLKNFTVPIFRQRLTFLVFPLKTEKEKSTGFVRIFFYWERQCVPLVILFQLYYYYYFFFWSQICWKKKKSIKLSWTIWFPFKTIFLRLVTFANVS